MTHGFEVILLALTVWGEARGEDYKGKLAVAWVICNRARFQETRLSRIVLKAWQFSFWNTNDPSRDDISDIDERGPVWEQCLKAATGAYFKHTIDPTYGAEFYYNPSVVAKPSWWDTDTTPDSEVKIGDHVFRRRK